MRRLDDIINDVDAEIAKIAGVEKTASEGEGLEDVDIFKLAEQMKSSPTTTAHAAPEPRLTLTEKVAHAVAITEVLNNLPTILKIQEFEKRAAAQGATPEQIAAYIEKEASGKLRGMKILGGLATAGGLAGAGGYAGHEFGKKKGRKRGRQEGWEQGVQDAAQFLSGR